MRFLTLGSINFGGCSNRLP